MAEFEVPQPIICSPFAEPAQHWLLEEGIEPRLEDGRRSSHYFYRLPPRTPEPKGPPAASGSSFPWSI